MWMRGDERNNVMRFVRWEKRESGSCVRELLLRERMDLRDWRMCEVDGGGKGIQACEIIKEGGRKGVEIVFIEVERGMIGERLGMV